MSFDYSKEDIVIQRQDETAVFWNEGGGVSIVQHQWPEPDALVVIPREALTAFWMRLRQMDEDGSP